MNLTKILNKVGLFTKSQVSKRAIGMANTGRLFADWIIGAISADTKTRKDLAITRTRSRELKDEYEYAQKYIRMLKTNVLGPEGVQLRNKAKDPDRVEKGKLVSGPLDIFANKQVQDGWWEWGKKENCTVTRKLTWCDAQNIILEACGTDGEHLVRLVRGFDNKFKFALQLLESDLLDIEYNKDLGNGHKIRMGIELDQWDAMVGVYLHKHNPSDWFPTSPSNFRYEFIPARDIIHPFLARRAGQTRGWPWMTVSGPGLKMAGDYEESESVASRVAAAKMFFLEQEGDVEYTGPEAPGGKYMDVEPGIGEVLPKGLRYKPHDPQHPNSAYQAFIKTRLRGIAAGLGVSYNTLANDMESVNFASGKLGLDEERLVWRTIQNWFGESVCNPVFEAWLEFAILTGNVKLPISKFDKFNQPEWRFQRWPQVNPQQEMSALQTALSLHLTSVTRELDKLSIDRDELFQEIADERAAAEALGLTLDDIGKAVTQAAGIAEAEAEFAPEPKPAG